MKISTIGILTSALFAAVPSAAAAQGVEDFYRDNTLRMIVGYSAGGGYDVYARLLARYMGKYLPGNPDIIVENMPGAGSLNLTSHLANVAPRDGSVIGAVGRGIPVEPLLGESGSSYDATELSWIGSMSGEVSVCVVWHTVDAESWDDVLNRETPIIFGGNGPAADNEVYPRMLINLLGANIRIISGYPGTPELGIAMEQGEIDGQCGSWSVINQRGDWLAEGRIKVLLQLGEESAPGLEEVPLVFSYAQTPEDLQIMQMVLSRLEVARPLVSPPDMPADRLSALRQAFMDATSDPDLVAEAEQMGLELGPMDGDTVTRIITELYETPDSIIEQTKRILAVN